MSTTQGPTRIEMGPQYMPTEADDFSSELGKALKPQIYSAALDLLRVGFDKGYAEGQRSKQAELDKAVELLRGLADHNLGLAEVPRKYASIYDAWERARAYLSTLNPQPDAAQ